MFSWLVFKSPYSLERALRNNHENLRNYNVHYLHFVCILTCSLNVLFNGTSRFIRRSWDIKLKNNARHNTLIRMKFVNFQRRNSKKYFKKLNWLQTSKKEESLRRKSGSSNSVINAKTNLVPYMSIFSISDLNQNI